MPRAKAPAQPWDYWIDLINADDRLSEDDKKVRITLCPLLRQNKYMGLWPSAPQVAFMLRPELEILYGGQPRAGKTAALLLAALQYVDVPGYNALIIRRTVREMRSASSIIPTLLEWLAPYIATNEVTWNEERLEVTFPSNATITFSFIDNVGDEKAVSKGRAYQFIGYEELTDWVESEDWHPYTYPFRSLQPHPTANVPLRMRSTTNPDDKSKGAGRAWVKARFLPPTAHTTLVGNSYIKLQPDKDIAYIHGVIEDNPIFAGAKGAQYHKSLSRMSVLDQQQHAAADWEAVEAGNVFNTSAIRIVPFAPQTVQRRGRGWDPAATEGGKGPRSAGVLMSRIDPRVARDLWDVEIQYVIEHVIAGRWSANTREDNIDVIACGSYIEGVRRGDARLGLLQLDNGKKIAWNGDPPGTKVLIEQEGAGSGKQVADATVTRLINKGVAAEAIKVSDSKEVRAHHFAAAVNNGMVGIVQGEGVEEFLAELRAFPNQLVKDFVDGGSLVFNWLLGHAAQAAAPRLGPPRVRPEVPVWAGGSSRRKG